VFADESTLSVVVTGGIGFTLVVYKNGEPIDEILVSSDPFTDERTVTAPETGEDRYRHQLDGDGGKTATVGGYVWLSKGTEPPPGTGGEAGGGGDGGSGGSPPSSDSSSGCDCGVVSVAGYDTGFVIALMFMLYGAWRATARRSRRRL
jgi:hypothetical protein